MKKYILPLLLLAVPSVLNAATAATQLEGSFKVGPAIILITILILFVLVGIFFRAKDTTDYYAAGRGISRVGSGMAIASRATWARKPQLGWQFAAFTSLACMHR